MYVPLITVTFTFTQAVAIMVGKPVRPQKKAGPAVVKSPRLSVSVHASCPPPIITQRSAMEWRSWLSFSLSACKPPIQVPVVPWRLVYMLVHTLAVLKF